MIVLGIDPGLDGAYAIFENGKCLRVAKLPFAEKDLCMVLIADALHMYTFRDTPDVVICEKVHSTPNDGHVGAFTFGMGFGHIKGFCQGRGWPLKLITPAAWKRQILKGKMGMPKQAVKYLQDFYPKYNPKDKALNKATTLAYVHEKYPNVDLTPGRCHLPQDGLADAVCLGEYGAGVA